MGKLINYILDGYYEGKLEENIRRYLKLKHKYNCFFQYDREDKGHKWCKISKFNQHNYYKLFYYTTSSTIEQLANFGKVKDLIDRQMAEYKGEANGKF